MENNRIKKELLNVVDCISDDEIIYDEDSPNTSGFLELNLKEITVEEMEAIRLETVSSLKFKPN